MRRPRWTGFLLLLVPLCTSDITYAMPTEPPPEEPLIKMDPYIVQGERVLPPRQSWYYSKVPAIELTRGKRVTITPGIELISNFSRKNTQVFIDELQLQQLAISILWPNLAAWSHRKIMVILDQHETPEIQLDWKDDPIHITNEDAQNTTQPPIPTNQQDAKWAIRDATDEQPLQSALPWKDNDPTPQVVASDDILGMYIPRLEYGSEESLARWVWAKYITQTISSMPKPAPAWFQNGIHWLIVTTKVSPTRITFASIQPTLLRQDGAFPSLTKILEKQKEDQWEGNEQTVAAAFTHWGLYGDNGKHRRAFYEFVEVLTNGKEPLEEVFQRCFKTKISKIEASLSTYTRSFSFFQSHELSGHLPDMPPATIREATESESAFLIAQYQNNANRPDLAINTLRIAYWRGERAPDMLAMLAKLEEAIGTIERAEKINQHLLSLPEPPLLSLMIDARLKYRSATKKKAKAEKLPANESNEILARLGNAANAGLFSEELCTFFSEVVLRSSGKTTNSTRTFLERASSRYPKNTAIKKALSL